jgi:hypothetical protein
MATAPASPTSSTPAKEGVSTEGGSTEGGQFHVDLEKGDTPPPGFVRGRTVVLVCAALVVGLLGLNLFSTVQGRKRDDRRSADAAAMWATSTTTHTLTPNETGITESFAAAAATDRATVDSIHRASAELLLTRRNVGDFSVRGEKNLTGREVLEAGIAELTVVRTETAAGAEFTYSSKNPEIQAALRSWAKAQSP